MLSSPLLGLFPNITSFVLSGMSPALDVQDATSTCQTPKRHLVGHVHDSGTLTYNESIRAYAYPEARLQPACIIKPSNPREVSTVLKIAGQHIVDDHPPRFPGLAVKGGGHNINAGWANIDCGITIDMKRMNDIKVDDAKKVVRVGAGAVWQDVYECLEPHGLSVLGGRIGNVGVAGLTLGGGISLFSAERGWVCDSLVNLQIVLASGAVVNANATSNSNLFAALKGGGNNFGVVTRFDFETFTQGPIWGGTVTYNSSSDVDRRLLTAFAHYKQPESFDEYTGMWLSFARNLSNAQQQSAFSILFHSKPDLAPGALQPFMDLQPQLKNAVAVNFPSTITRSISEVAARPDTYIIWETNTFTVPRIDDKPSVLHKVYDLWADLSTRIGGADTSIYIQSIPPSPPTSQPNSFGVLPSSQPQKNHVLFQVVVAYKSPLHTRILEHLVKEFVQDVDELTRREGAFVSFKYANYAGWFRNIWESNGREGMLVEKLRNVSRQYDPGGMFQKQVPGGWKLF